MWNQDGTHGAKSKNDNLGIGNFSIPASLSRPARFIHLRKHLCWLMETGAPTEVVYYRPFSRGDDATRCAWGAVGIIEEVFAETALLSEYTDSTVRSHFGLLKQGAEKRKELKQLTMDFVMDKGFDVTNDDEADAVLLLLYFRETVACA